ncbi:helix-turn-helix domain-containing protein [Sphingobacterium sp. lm-10]|uniref:helix-turn-helix domain-containing protein n=1 Tax=Sphingobacterium sp. lm-10 TaxID=2944904 RepID=UPI0020206BCD|nr:helix-turn-helix domain-containing protein [Sphingobacterium sp. lm-10]MCL7987053.1 helix-turn-helix domain-containing protein [Sphingobacterium sp. lm-10]
MQVNILTKEDLNQFKTELIAEIKLLLSSGDHAVSNKPRWLRSSEVRKLMSISPGTLQNLRINGVLPYRKVGGIMFYAMEDIQKMMEGGKYNG